MSLVVVCSLFAINNCDVHCSLIEPVPSAAPKSQLCVVIEPNLLVSSRILEENKVEMPPKSNNQKKKEAEAAGRAPKKTKQQENAGGLIQEHKTCDILAAERLQLMRLDNRLIIDSFQKAICILKW